LHRVVALLDGHAVGNGSLFRACQQAQAELRAPSVAVDGRPGGKWAR
jgi:hypothetical protein